MKSLRQVTHDWDEFLFTQEDRVEGSLDGTEKNTISASSSGLGVPDTQKTDNGDGTPTRLIRCAVSKGVSSGHTSEGSTVISSNEIHVDNKNYPFEPFVLLEYVSDNDTDRRNFLLYGCDENFVMSNLPYKIFDIVLRDAMKKDFERNDGTSFREKYGFALAQSYIDYNQINGNCENFFTLFELSDCLRVTYCKQPYVPPYVVAGFKLTNNETTKKTENYFDEKHQKQSNCVGDELNDVKHLNEKVVWAFTISPPHRSYSYQLQQYIDLFRFSDMIETNEIRIFPEFEKGRLHYHCIVYPTVDNYGLIYQYLYNLHYNRVDFPLKVQGIVGYTKTYPARPKYKNVFRTSSIKYRCMYRFKTQHLDHPIDEDGWYNYCTETSAETIKILGYSEVTKGIWNNLKTFCKSHYKIECEFVE